MPKVIFRSNELIEFRRNRQCPADCMGRNCYGRCIVLTEEEINEAFKKVPPILECEFIPLERVVPHYHTIQPN